LTVCPNCLRNTASEPDHNRETCSNDMSSDVHQPCWNATKQRCLRHTG
jgi:hypothetical protein